MTYFLAFFLLYLSWENSVLLSKVLLLLTSSWTISAPVCSSTEKIEDRRMNGWMERTRMDKWMNWREDVRGSLTAQSPRSVRPKIPHLRKTHLARLLQGFYLPVSQRLVGGVAIK